MHLAGSPGSYFAYLKDWGSHITINWFSCGYSILVELELGMLVFAEGGGGGETGEPEKNPRSKAKTQAPTQPANGNGLVKAFLQFNARGFLRCHQNFNVPC